MTSLVEIRNEEMLCRERALVEPERKQFWLKQADEWAKRALNAIASDLEAEGTQKLIKPGVRSSAGSSPVLPKAVGDVHRSVRSDRLTSPRSLLD
jgi:hypothetical protein